MKRAQERTVEDFLWIIGPFAIIVLVVFIFNLFRSPYLVYRADHENEQRLFQTIENRAQSAEQALQQERDKNSPKFELSWASSVIGDGVLIENGRRTNYTELYLQIGVLNRGAPSVIKEWKGLLRLTDGKELEGRLLLGNDKSIHTPVETKHGRIELPISPNLIPKWSITPIPTGGRGVGSVVFLFPPGMKEKMEGPGGAFVVKLWDMNGKEYKIEAPWQKFEIPDIHDINALPGMELTH